MNFLGIDYGEKRVGLAKANSETKIATPLFTIENNKEIFSYLGKIIEKEEINKVILGIPKSFDGKEYAFANKIRSFGEELSKKTSKNIYFQNEILTSSQAKRHEVKDVDSSAAALILQAFLDHQRGK